MLQVVYLALLVNIVVAKAFLIILVAVQLVSSVTNMLKLLTHQLYKNMVIMGHVLKVTTALVDQLLLLLAQ